MLLIKLSTDFVDNFSKFAMILLHFFLNLQRSVKKMDKFKLPISWIDRIFVRLNEIYGSQCNLKLLDDVTLGVERVRWQTGLFGATADEIKYALELCRQNVLRGTPNVIDFYAYCKRKKKITNYPKKRLTNEQKNKQRAYFALITGKLNGSLDSQGQAALSAINQQVLEQQDSTIKHWQDR